MANKPIKKYKYGKVEGAVWESEYQGRKNYSMSFQKSWKQADGSWKQSTSFYNTDLRDLYILIGSVLYNQVNAVKTEQTTTPEPPDVNIQFEPEM